MVQNSYDEAVECLQYTVVMGHNKVIHYKDLEEFKKSAYKGYTFKLEKELFNSLRQGSICAVEAKLSEIFEFIVSSKKMPYEYTSYILIQLLCSTLKYVYEIGADVEEIFRTTNVFGDILQMDTMKKKYQWFREVYARILEYMTEKRENAKNDIVCAVLEYIRQNYTQELSLAVLSEKFYLSGPYLSKIFKEVTGESIKRYINNYRIEKAKEFLRNSNYNIETISRKVGYDNVRSFMKTFRNYVGMSPGDYRKMLVVSNENGS